MHNLCLLSFLAVGRVASAADFPVGLYGVPADAPLAAIAEAGFTTIIATDTTARSQLEFARRARAVGLEFIAHPNSGVRLAAPAMDWPVSAWYLADEPEIWNQSPEQIDALADEWRKWDPKRPIVIVVGDGKFAHRYAPHVDELWVDWYPVPHLPLETVGREITVAIASAAAKPVMAVIQAMDWRDYPQRDPAKQRVGRFPAFREMRFMAYHAAIRGARGLYFFEFRKRGSPGISLMDAPEHWLAVRVLARELSTLRPYLSRPGTYFEEYGIEGRSWALGSKEIVVLLNPGSSPAPIPQRFLTATCRALFETRMAPKDVFPDGTLPPKRVLALRTR